MADLIKILFFLLGSAALGFLLGRRSRNSDVAVLEAQSAEKQRAFVDIKSKLDRCTAKRANLERELSNRQKGKAISTSSATASPASSRPKTQVPGSQKEAQPKSTPPKAASPKTASPQKSSPTPAPSQSDGSRSPESRRPESRTSTKGNDQQRKKAKTASDNNQDEALERVKANAGRVNFDRIGRATEAEKNNLKRIKGVGPFLERKLNALGIYTFAQIANFTDEDKDVVNEAIEFFPGRISRDNWVDQAKKLRQEQKN